MWGRSAKPGRSAGLMKPSMHICRMVRSAGCIKVCHSTEAQVGSTLPADPGAACSASATINLRLERSHDFVGGAHAAVVRAVRGGEIARAGGLAGEEDLLFERPRQRRA